MVRAFYIAHNKGHWGTVSELVSPHVRSRSNSGYIVMDPPGGAMGYEKIGGALESRDKLVAFLKKRSEEAKRSFWFKDENLTITPDGYACSFVEANVEADCKGIWCSNIPRFVHVFWCNLDEQEGAIIQSRIEDFTEIELMKVGMQ